MTAKNDSKGDASKSATVDESPKVDEQPNPPATVAQRQYAPGTGWELGQLAPADRFVELDPQGNITGKATTSAPKGKAAVQVAIKGAPVTAETRRALGLDK
jgi:hypothetical protein